MADVSVWWVVGWAVGFGGAVAAAILLLVVIRLGKEIASQARAARDAIESAHDNTEALFELTTTNLTIDRIVRGFRVIREERSP